MVNPENTHKSILYRLSWLYLCVIEYICVYINKNETMHLKEQKGVYKSMVKEERKGRNYEIIL